MWRRAEGIMARGRRKRGRDVVAEEPVEGPDEPDLEERYDECRKSPLICMATYEDC